MPVTVRIHVPPYEGDNGIQFEPIDDKEQGAT